MRKVEETSPKYSHEEVVTWMLFHTKFTNVLNTLVIRTADTNILVIIPCEHALHKK